MYKLRVGKIPESDFSPCIVTRLHRLASALVNHSDVTIEEKRRILVVFALNGYGCYAPAEVKELLYRDAIAPHIPDGHELTERDGEWGIWPIKPESPVIACAWPAWAEYAAMDSSGTWYWYDEEPVASSGVWGSAKHITGFHPSEAPAFKGDWKDSLVKNRNK